MHGMNTKINYFAFSNRRFGVLTGLLRRLSPLECDTLSTGKDLTNVLKNRRAFILIKQSESLFLESDLSKRP